MHRTSVLHPVPKESDAIIDCLPSTCKGCGAMSGQVLVLVLVLVQVVFDLLRIESDGTSELDIGQSSFSEIKDRFRADL